MKRKDNHPSELRALKKKYNLTWPQVAQALDTPLRTMEDWASGRVRMPGAAKKLTKILLSQKLRRHGASRRKGEEKMELLKVAKIERETENALLVALNACTRGGDDVFWKSWLPKSQVKLGKGFVETPSWLVNRILETLPSHLSLSVGGETPDGGLTFMPILCGRGGR